MANTRVTTPVTDFKKSTSLPGLKLPSGDNSNQPAGAAAAQGMIRNDTEETVDSSASAIAHYNGTAWQYFAATESPVPDPNLKMYLDASDTASYPGTGNTWYDLTYNNNNGAINGAGWNSTGYFDFNGSSDYVDFGVYPFGTGQNISYSFWINPSSANADNDGTFLIYVPAANSHSPPYYSHCIALESSSSRLRLEYLTNDGSGIIKLESGASTLSLGSWHHYALTRENNIAKWYKNGAPTGAQVTFNNITTAFNATTGITRVGSRVNTNYYEGFISKLHVYDKGLTPAEVTALYNEGKGF
jgi:hypothetical protein